MPSLEFVRSGDPKMDKLSPFQCERCGTASEFVIIDRQYVYLMNHHGHVIRQVLIDETITVRCHGTEMFFNDSRDVQRIRDQIIPRDPFE